MSNSKVSRFMALVLTLSLCSFKAYADDAQQLRKTLSSMQALSADFSSEVVSASGSSSNSFGKIALKRPDRMILHTLSPEETVLYTQDHDLYYYDPFVSQLSIYSRSNSVSSPFLLLTDNSDSLWQNYEVQGSKDTYTVIPKKAGDIVSMELSFEAQSVRSLRLKMKDGTVNTYTLSNVKPSASEQDFDVKIPEDTEIDDERGTN